MINTKLQNIIDTKAAIGNAIVNKGGAITSSTPFYNYAAEIDNLATGGGGAGIDGYQNWAAQDTDNVKYTVHNGFDYVTNPTPNPNTIYFNKWIENNTTTNTVVINNTKMDFIGNYNGPNTVFGNQADLSLIRNSPLSITSIAYTNVIINNNYIYLATSTGGNIVEKRHLSNFGLVGTTTYNGIIQAMAINNGFLYIGGNIANAVRKHYESNLEFFGQTSAINIIDAIAINNGFLYFSSLGSNRIQKYYEDNLTFLTESTTGYNRVLAIAINNGVVWATGNGSRLVRYNESDLSTISTGFTVGNGRALTINNGFLYVGGISERVIKFSESNAEQIGFINMLTTAPYSGTTGHNTFSLLTHNGFVYIGSTISTNTPVVSKIHESNLVFVGNTIRINNIVDMHLDNNTIYTIINSRDTVYQFATEGFTTYDNQALYAINTINEVI